MARGCCVSGSSSKQRGKTRDQGQSYAPHFFQAYVLSFFFLSCPAQICHAFRIIDLLFGLIVAGYPILSKTDVETMFKIMQDAEENKKLVYVSAIFSPSVKYYQTFYPSVTSPSDLCYSRICSDIS